MLKQYIDEKNISIYSLAKKCRISYSALNDLANGKTDINNMRLGAAIRLAAALDIDLPMLINLCQNEKHTVSPKYGLNLKISTKNKSYYASFTYLEKPVELCLCKVTERNTQYAEIIAGWEADKYAAKKNLKEF